MVLNPRSHEKNVISRSSRKTKSQLDENLGDCLLFVYVEIPHQKRRGKKGGILDHDSLFRSVTEVHRLRLFMAILYASGFMFFGV